MIVLYTIHCPMCKVLQKKLDSKNINYIIEDNTDKVVEKGNEVGISSAPFLLVDDTAYSFKDAINWLNNQ